MYRSYFGFHRHPFGREVPTEQLFAAPVLDELHARMNYLVETRGIGLVTGEPGSGTQDGNTPSSHRASFRHAPAPQATGGTSSSTRPSPSSSSPLQISADAVAVHAAACSAQIPC